MFDSKKLRLSVAGLLLVAAGALLVTLLDASPGHAARKRRARVVLLNAEGKPAAEWVAAEMGQMSDGTYVFEVEHGVGTRTVRISGNFIAEHIE